MELLLILVLALIVFGPNQLPSMMGQIGRAIRDFQKATSELSDEFNRTIQSEIDQTKAAIEGTTLPTASPPASFSTPAPAPPPAVQEAPLPAPVLTTPAPVYTAPTFSSAAEPSNGMAHAPSEPTTPSVSGAETATEHTILPPPPAESEPNRPASRPGPTGPAPADDLLPPY